MSGPSARPTITGPVFAGLAAIFTWFTTTDGFARALGTEVGRSLGGGALLLLALYLTFALYAQRTASATLPQPDERRLQTLMDHLPGLIYRCKNDPDWTVEFVSKGSLSLTGYHPDEFLPPDNRIAFGALIHPDDKERVWDTVQEAVEKKEPFTLTYRIRSRSGESKWIWEQGRGVWTEGELVALEGLLLDITRQKNLERQLAHAQKMEAVGRLSAGIAHDFNNLLMAIMGFSELAERALPDAEAVRNHLGRLQATSDRAARLTKRLLSFSRPGKQEAEILDLAEFLQGTEGLLDRTLGETIRVSFEPRSPDPVLVAIDPGHLEQILLNLAVNARDAMPDGGELIVTTERRDVETEETGIPDHLPPGTYGTFTVRDTGLGMTPETVEHAFDPFFTTKKKDDGTGLGLSTVYRLIRGANGFTQVTSEPDRGTTVAVHLPVQKEPATLAEEKPVHAPTPFDITGLTVLVVEDRDTVRAIVKRVLEESGSTVVEAEHGQEALERCPESGLDLLITDIAMPHLNGWKLADRLKERYPELGILYMSGHESGRPEERELEDREVFLEKPFSSEDLKEALRSILEQA